MRRYFGTDGIRGKAEMFSYDFLERIIRGLEVKNKSVLIGGDTRESTEEILRNLTKLLKDYGAKKVGELGVFPTPGINIVMKTLCYDFAIDVTASHNPYTDNGIKIFEFDGKNAQKLNDEGRERIERTLANDSLSRPLPEEEVATEIVDEKNCGLDIYKKHLASSLGLTSLAKLRILIDCANGATGVISGEVFREHGAEVKTINDDRSFGRKINDGVGSTHIEELQKQVRVGEFDCGAAFDGDGDRCIMVDENGEIVDGDQMLAIIANYFGLDKIVGTVMANQGLINWGKEADVEVILADVGDQNVAKMMKERDVRIGGEQSGHIILPDEDMGDGMLTALTIAKILAETKRPLSELALIIKKSPQTMVNAPANRTQKELLKTSEKVRAIIDDFGQKLKDVNGRLLVRPSGTEELVRITLWGESQPVIDELGKELATKLMEVFTNGRN
ncbi:phosphoglucosamine mutase [Candidatus Saccharibacteria bacterium]|nr:phosphoglucosamine mutase [Candidatus Saccharibacteria bacterium]